MVNFIVGLKFCEAAAGVPDVTRPRLNLRRLVLRHAQQDVFTACNI